MSGYLRRHHLGGSVPPKRPPVQFVDVDPLVSAMNHPSLSRVDLDWGPALRASCSLQRGSPSPEVNLGDRLRTLEDIVHRHGDTTLGALVCTRRVLVNLLSEGVLERAFKDSVRSLARAVYSAARSAGTVAASTEALWCLWALGEPVASAQGAGGLVAAWSRATGTGTESRRDHGGLVSGCTALVLVAGQLMDGCAAGNGGVAEIRAGLGHVAPVLLQHVLGVVDEVAKVLAAQVAMGCTVVPPCMRAAGSPSILLDLVWRCVEEGLGWAPLPAAVCPLLEHALVSSVGFLNRQGHSQEVVRLGCVTLLCRVAGIVSRGALEATDGDGVAAWEALAKEVLGRVPGFMAPDTAGMCVGFTLRLAGALYATPRNVLLLCPVLLHPAVPVEVFACVLDHVALLLATATAAAATAAAAAGDGSHAEDVQALRVVCLEAVARGCHVRVWMRQEGRQPGFDHPQERGLMTVLGALARLALPGESSPGAWPAGVDPVLAMHVALPVLLEEAAVTGDGETAVAAMVKYLMHVPVRGAGVAGGATPVLIVGTAMLQARDVAPKAMCDCMQLVAMAAGVDAAFHSRMGPLVAIVEAAAARLPEDPSVQHAALHVLKCCLVAGDVGDEKILDVRVAAGRAALRVVRAVMPLYGHLRSIVNMVGETLAAAEAVGHGDLSREVAALACVDGQACA